LSNTTTGSDRVVHGQQPPEEQGSRLARFTRPAVRHWQFGVVLAAAIAATGSDARLVWTPAEAIEAAGIAPWIELPIWLPPEGEAAGMHNGDVSAVYAAGLTCRPVEETIADTWAWLQREGDPQPKPGRPAHGLDPERERAVLASLAA